MSSLNPRTTSAFEAASVGRDMSPGSSPPNSTSILPIQASIPILCPIPLDSNPPDSSRPYPHSSTSGVAPSRRRHHRIRGSSEEEKEEEEAILVRTVMWQPSSRQSPFPNHEADPAEDFLPYEIEDNRQSSEFCHLNVNDSRCVCLGFLLTGVTPPLTLLISTNFPLPVIIPSSRTKSK